MVKLFAEWPEKCARDPLYNKVARLFLFILTNIGQFQKISIPYRGWHLWPGILKAWGVFMPGIPKAWGISVLDFQRATTKRKTRKHELTSSFFVW